MDLSIFASPEAWISLVSLIFLEIVLGVDNLVFISITTNRLPEDKQHIGRKLGLAGALVMRIVFLCFASFLVHMTEPLFTVDLGPYTHGFSVRDLVLLIGGGYLIYKGIAELRDTPAHRGQGRALRRAQGAAPHPRCRRPWAPSWSWTWCSPSTRSSAVGMADHLIIMIIAVMSAVFLMMIFIDPISNFINGHRDEDAPRLRSSWLSAGCSSSTAPASIRASSFCTCRLEKLIVCRHGVLHRARAYPDALQRELPAWRKERWKNETAAQIENVRTEMLEELKREAAADAASGKRADAARRRCRSRRPVIIGNNVYVMMPMVGEDAASFKTDGRFCRGRGIVQCAA